MVKQLTFETDAKESIVRGVNKLAKAVTSTLGPRGHNAVLDKGWGGPTVTKDGVSVAEEIELSDRCGRLEGGLSRVDGKLERLLLAVDRLCHYCGLQGTR